MKLDEAISLVKPHLTKERFDHTLRVVQKAVELAEIYDVEPEQVELAAVFHDYAKNRPIEELKRLIKASTLPKDLLHYHHELWHGPVGAILIEHEYGIVDANIQNAIQYHTTGRAYMSKLELTVFLADYIEPGRDITGLDEVRKVAQKDLEHACWMVSRNTIQFLTKKRMRIYPDTFHAYNNLTKWITQNKSY